MLRFCDQSEKTHAAPGPIDVFETSKRTAAFCGLIVLISGPAVSPATAQSQQQIEWCINAAHAVSPDQQISDCTAAIESGKWSGQGLAWALNNRGFAYWLKGDLDPAFADFEQAIRLDPKDAVAFNNRGLIHQFKDDLDRAIADYSEAIRLDPGYVFAFNNRGGVYAYKDDYDRAIADYSEAIRLDPTFAVAIKARGNAYAAKRDFDRAIADYDRLIALDPKYAAAFYNRGIAYQMKGDLDRAIADYNVAVRLDPQDANAFNNRANVYALEGEFDHAVADYNEAIRLEPKQSGFYLNRALAKFYSGNMSQALSDLDQSSVMNPKSAYAALWREIVGGRSNQPSRLAQAVTRINMSEWPAPVIRLYLDQTTRDAVLAAADDPNARIKKSRVCEANFFIGELALLHGAKDEAVQLFRLGTAECGEYTFLRMRANAELKALGAQP